MTWKMTWKRIARWPLQKTVVQGHVQAKLNRPAIETFLHGKMRWHLSWMAIYRLGRNVDPLLRDRVTVGVLEAGARRRKADFSSSAVLQQAILGLSKKIGAPVLKTIGKIPNKFSDC